MSILLIAHFLAAMSAPALVRVFGRKAFLMLATLPAAATVWGLAQSNQVLNGTAPVEHHAWVPLLDLNITLSLDTLSWVMVLLVGLVGTLVMIYCSAYFSASATSLGRFASVLTAFAGAMLGLVIADNLLVVYTFWELTTVFSYLLIGHYHERKTSRRAAMEAIIITTAGGLAMLGGMILLGNHAGTFEISQLLEADNLTGTLVGVAAALILAGAVTKSALIPFHFWLPAAMAAPTPVSAYLHAAAMVKAGVYLVARFAPALAELAVWRYSVLVLGGGTLLIGGYRALRQHDLKLVLAFGTVSQLGMMIMLVGSANRAVALAGLAMLVSHALFKAALFLIVGTIDVSTGTRDLRRLSGLGRKQPLLATSAALAIASMAGVPPLLGYVAKEAALEGLLHSGFWYDGVALVAIAVGSALTAAYGLRFFWGAFWVKEVIADPSDSPEQVTAEAAKELVPTSPHAEPAAISFPPFVLVWPAALLAVLGLILGLLPGTVERFLAPHAATYPAGEAGHLALWAGFGPPVYITAGVLLLAVLGFVFRNKVELFQVRLAAPVSAENIYRKFMRKLDDLAADVTAFTQRGSLPFYLQVILLVFIVGTGMVLALNTKLPTEIRLVDRPAQVLFAVLAVTAAVLSARSRRRLKAVLLAGVAGYSVAALYLLHGAPDLALTQTLVETVTLVVFVLVLRRLPAFFSNRPLRDSHWVRVAIATLAGLAVVAIGLIAPGARIHDPTSNHYAEEGVEFGGGSNLVNVTLVDIRAWDTMGEISVLLVAATGVASLLFLNRRGGQIFRSREVKTGTVAVWGAGAPKFPGMRQAEAKAPAENPLSTRSREWLRGSRTLAMARRSVIFEVVTRLLFHTMIVFSVYLLFAGHNLPGGGFVAGLVVGLALVIRYLAAGRYELGEAAPIQPGLLLGAGLVMSAGYGVVAMINGLSMLESVAWDFSLPLIGDVHMVSSLFFDIGVYLVVIGLVLDILRSLGAEIDRQIEIESPDTPNPPRPKAEVKR